MRKRRVFALLLAMSLVVSGNGMTVLAAEQEPEAITTQEEASESAPEEEKKEETGEGESLLPGGGSEKTETPSEEEKKQEETDPGALKEDDRTGGEQSSAEKEELKEEIPAKESPVENTVSQNDIDDMGDEESEETTDEVRIVSFTDATGMTITYDAVQATGYDVEVRAGTLLRVPNAEGVLDLREEQGITEIGADAFKGDTNIKYVMLPATVKTIGAGAFEGCSALKGISITSRLTTIGAGAFKGCASLTQLALPNSVTSIGANAFQNDGRLFMVHMVSAEYARLREIGAGAFEGCRALELFCSDEDYHLPDSLTTIGDNAFKGCRKISRINMSDSVTSLGQGVYADCTGLTEIVLSSGLTLIPTEAFAGCTGLARITFGNKNMSQSTEIATHAFYNCRNLGNVELPEQINKVNTNAFEGCTSLKRIYVKNGRAVLEDKAFPDRNAELCLVGTAGSSAQAYAEKENASVRFVSTDEPEKVEYFTYKSKISGVGTDTADPITIKVINTKSPSSSTPDINSIKNGTNTDNGVKAGTICYLQIDYRGLTGIQPVAGSIKCNGVPMDYAGGWYSFTMPHGGATVTAEFALKSGSVLVVGSEGDIEGRLSSDFEVKNKAYYATMKVGQSTKFYLTDAADESGSRIPVTKITYSLSPNSDKGVVSIDANGTVKALKEGTAVVCARVKNIAGDTIDKLVTIKVGQADINHISMRVTSYDKNTMKIQKDETDTDRITGVTVPTRKVTKNYTFDLKAAAFSTEEDAEAMAVAFTWATSDAKVAKLAKASTTTASSVNTITIPQNTDGEATITVTATNADKTKVTQKFTVSVENYTPRLASSKITVNPNQVDDTTKLEIISAYGKKITPGSVKVLDAKVDREYGDFTLAYEGATTDTDPVYTFGVTARDGLPDKTYSVRIQVEAEYTTYEIPLQIVVKKSIPNPTVSFARTQQKINLFYANDHTEILPVIGNLGTAVVKEYKLEALTAPGSKTYEDDVRFEENFEVKVVDGKPVITQKAETLKCNKSKKPVLTGYLVLTFEDYKKEISKKYKITIPTQTTAPAYVLNTTANNFSAGCKSTQTVYLQLLDKKTKQPVDLHPNVSEGTYTLTKWNTSTTDAANCSIVNSADAEHEGMIKVTINRNPDKGRLVMRLTNDTWAEGKEFLYTYQVNTDARDPKLSLKTATVNLNASYPEQTETFELVSNQYDTVIAENQDFERPVKLTAASEEQYDKLEVSYENGKGSVSLVDNDIKAGTYKFTCAVKQKGAKWATNTVTLNVRVAKTIPTVTLKGTNTFNLMAYTEEKVRAASEDGGQNEVRRNYIEKSEMTLTTKNLPADYTLDFNATCDTIECTTRNYGGAEECFDFQWVAAENKMVISLIEEMPAGTYTFKMLPVYSYRDNQVSPAKYSTFSIKVYNGAISVRLGAKGKINLVDRGGIPTEKNGIRYTPVFTNLKDTLEEVVILDASGEYPTYNKDDSKFLSSQFEAKIEPDGKSFIVVPKAGVELENKKSYSVRIWMKTAGYQFPSNSGGIYAPGTVKISTAEVLPKVKTDKTAVDLYLSSKSYQASFVVSKADVNAVGDIESITFGEKDDKAAGSFEIRGVPQNDGSIRVYLKLRNAVSYGCNTNNKITMYIKFTNQGSNTAGTAVNMSVKINK